MAPLRPPLLHEDAETLSVEVAAILTHARSAKGEALLAFLASPDEFTGVLPVLRTIILATLEPREWRNEDLRDRAAAVGVAAEAARVDPTDLMTGCTQVLTVTEKYLSRARPELAQEEEWQQHWSTTERVVSRAVLLGHRRASFATGADWRAALHDPTALQPSGLRGAAEREATRSAERRAVVTGNDRAMAVDAIRAAAARLDTGEDAVIATDTSGTILYWNDGATNLYGWRSAEVLGRDVLGVTPASQTVREAERIMHQLLAGQPWSGQFIVRDKSGSPMRVLVTDIPVMHGGGVVGIVGLSTASRGP